MVMDFYWCSDQCHSSFYSITAKSCVKSKPVLHQLPPIRAANGPSSSTNWGCRDPLVPSLPTSSVTAQGTRCLDRHCTFSRTLRLRSGYSDSILCRAGTPGWAELSPAGSGAGMGSGSCCSWQLVSGRRGTAAHFCHHSVARVSGFLPASTSKDL